MHSHSTLSPTWYSDIVFDFVDLCDVVGEWAVMVGLKLQWYWDQVI
jgi:hypothetical protein